MDSFLVRSATEKDTPEMLELIRELANYENAADEVTVSMDHFVASGFGENPVWWAIVGEDLITNKVVGLALYYIRYSTWKGQRMYLEDIIITKEWRKKGMGKVLMNELINIAEQKKFSGISWQVLDWNEDAIQFYKNYPVTFDDSWINVNF